MICGHGHEQNFKYPYPRESKIIQMPYPRAKAIDQNPALCPAFPLPAGLTLIGAKQRQADARKAAATRKQKSDRQKSSNKVATAGNEFWCLCGGSESGNMITCDNRCRIKWFHLESVGLVDAPNGKWLCTECAVKYFQSYHSSEMLCCNVKIISLQLV